MPARPRSARVGEVDRGWSVVRFALGLEQAMAFAELHERFVESACRWALVGGRPAGLLLEDADGALAGARFAEDFLHTPVNTIYGGSAEIPRSLVAEVELGLPRSR